MTTTTHSASVHIEVPVERVFEYVTDPVHFYEAMPKKMRPGQGLRAKHMTPEGVGSTYEWVTGHIGGFELVGVLTREEYAVNERIVDKSSTGPQWTWAVQPDGEGTRLALTFEYSTKIPGIDKLIDLIAWRGDADLEAMLATVQEKVEAA
jgi:hypothetical protein